MRARRALMGLCIGVCAGMAGTMPGALAQTSAAAGAAWGLPQLMRSLAQVKSASAHFTERKTMSILSAPLVAVGTLSYTAPDQMDKITTSPVPERFVLSGQQVSITSGQNGQAHVFLLTEAPQIAGLTEGILGTLAGDLPGLERVYDVQVSGGPLGWQLVLQPKDAATKSLIDWIAIRGAQNRIQTIDTQSRNGDHSEMSIAEDVSDAR